MELQKVGILNVEPSNFQETSSHRETSETQHFFSQGADVLASGAFIAKR